MVRSWHSRDYRPDGSVLSPLLPPPTTLFLQPPSAPLPQLWSQRAEGRGEEGEGKEGERERGQAGKGTRASAQSWKPEPEKASKDHVCAWQSMTGPERPFPAGPASWATALSPSRL